MHIMRKIFKLDSDLAHTLRVCGKCEISWHFWGHFPCQVYEFLIKHILVLGYKDGSYMHLTIVWIGYESCTCSLSLSQFEVFDRICVN